MAKYKIKVVGLLLRNNQMAEFGDIVDEESFSSPASELKKQGYIDLATKADINKLEEAEKETEKEAEEEAEAQRLVDEEAKEEAEKVSRAGKK